MTDIAGWAHLTLSVQDHDRSVAWYCEVLGFRSLFTQTTERWRRTLCQHPDSDIVLVLHQHIPGTGAHFDERNTGLDHVAFSVSDVDALLRWQERLSSLGVPYTPIADAPPRGGKVLHFRDPDGIPLELFWRPRVPPSDGQS